MYYRKQVLYKPKHKLKLKFSSFSGGINTETDENILPQKYAKMTYNFEAKSGALKKGAGFEPVRLPASRENTALSREPIWTAGRRILKCWYYKRYDADLSRADDKLIIFDQDHRLYYIDIYGGGAEFTQIEDIEFEGIPAAINYRLNDEDVIIFSSPEDSMVVWNGVNLPYIVHSAPNIGSMCVHYERLFATIDGEKSSLWFSADLDPTNWDVALDAAGFIEMIDERGQLIKVVSFMDYIYVFRNNGIARVSAYGEQTQFTVSQLYVGTSKIYPESVIICGDRIIFLAEDGLYVFDGLNTYKILENIKSMFYGCDNGRAVGAYINGKYYLACRLNYGDAPYLCENGEYVNNTLLQYDLATRSFSLSRGADIAYMTTVHNETFSRLILCFRDAAYDNRLGYLSDCGKYFETGLKKIWLTPNSDFGYPDKKKVVKNLYILSKEDITLNVNCDGRTTAFFINGGQNITEQKINLSGNVIGLEFISETENPYISSPTFTIDAV
jgi:hypothetical protein